MPHSAFVQVLLILSATILLALAILLLSFYKRLFTSVRIPWLRRNLSVLSVAVVFMFAFLVLQSPELFAKVSAKGAVNIILKELLKLVIIIVFVYNIVWLIARIPTVKGMSFIKHHAIIILSIVVSAIFIYTAVNYVDNGMSFAKLHSSLLYAYFNSVCTGLVYTAINYVELDRKRKLNEKELEVTKLMALKTKAELEALHSKINPHFLYNALNSIADLSITDGKKARKMTVALADLFRYSINYSDHNYSTVKEEVEMTEVYLEIEKIRFEDQLNYSIVLADDVNHYLIPRFILQPVVENAVKHGLKATGKMTEINIKVNNGSKGLQITVSDNGPAFPDELIPGYGVKSIYDKLDLLFPGDYEIHFSNQPQKNVSIHIHKLIKNEPAV
ncbi:MAG TPA: histidine kinase [Chitinophagaceae bacterium]|jgi:sensor histidine kinase YesM|nr:histidine kinase [Chitinophagaceae bacterium]